MKQMSGIRTWGAIVASMAISTLLATQANAAAGRTAGSFNVSPTGAATYTIPIWVPPGPRGMQPNLALVYNSNGGDGNMGIGWTVSGLSAITRCPQNVAQDGVAAAIALNFTDRFCLNGNRLRVINGSYGGDGTTYKTEMADFSLTTSYLTTGSGPQYFVVKAKNGMTYEYGNSATSQVFASSVVANSTPHAWLMSKVTDQSGNIYTVTYRDGATGSYGVKIPDKISYGIDTANASVPRYTVVFNYDVRTNVGPGVVGAAATGQIGSYTWMGYTLSYGYYDSSALVNVMVLDRSTVVRKYVPAYEVAPTTSALRMKQVKECADLAESDCLSPTNISYYNANNGVPSSGVVPAMTQVLSVADVNGDGKQDFVYTDASNNLTVAFAQAAGFSAPAPVGVVSPGYAKVVVADFAGSGKADILMPSSGIWQRYSWNGTSFTATTTGVPTFGTPDSGDWAAGSADTDGDGRPDLLMTDTFGSKTATLQIRLNTTTGTTLTFDSGTNTPLTTSTSWCANAFTGCYSPYLRQTSKRRKLDVNGDGREDFVLYFSSYAWNGYSYVNGTWAITPSSGLLNTNNTWLAFVDWNGDNCTDTIYGTSVQVSGCSGSSPVFYSYSGQPLAAADYNHDGLDDILINNGGTIGVYQSTGTGISPLISTVLPSSGTVFVMDQNGDGLDDIVVGTAANFSAWSPIDLVSTVTDGFGLASTASYIYTGSGSSNYTAELNATYPYADVLDSLAAQSVVSQVVASDGAGGNYIQQFFYSGGRFNYQGRGFQGFHTRTIIDNRSTTTPVVKTTFKNTFPFSGMIEKLEVFQHNGLTLISQIDNVITETRLDTVDGTSGERHFPYVSSSTSLTNEVGGVRNALQITSTSSGYTFDNFGNLTASSVAVTDKDASSPNVNQVWTTATSADYSTGQNTTNIGYNCTGIPTHTTVTRSSPGSAITRTVDYTVDYNKCRVDTKTTEQGNAVRRVDQAFYYDAFGNVNHVSVTGRDRYGTALAARHTYANWGTTGQFPEITTNALGQQTISTFDYSHGVQLSEKDPNNITVSWTYDNYLRKLTENRPDSTSTVWSYTDCTVSGGCFNANNRLIVSAVDRNADTNAQSTSTTYLDQLGRTLATTSPSVTGAVIRSETQYNNLGQVSQQSAPCVASGCAAFWTTFTYDALGRVTTAKRPTSASNAVLLTTSVFYEGRTVRTRDPLLRDTTKILTVGGTLARSQDAAGYFQNFSYDAFGSLTNVQDGQTLASLFSATYDYGVSAFQNTVSDANLGASSYFYDSLGELTHYTDAKSQNFSNLYDALGRVTQRNEPDQTTTWTWGTTAANHDIGQLYSVSNGGYSEVYGFDTQGRPASRTINADNAYLYQYAYDTNTGFLDTLRYPTSNGCYNVKLKYGYANGQLQSIRDYSNNTLGTTYWQATETNALGGLKRETLGNGVIIEHGVDAVTGQLGYQYAGVGGGTALQNAGFLYDEVGNVKQRQNNNAPGLTENFWYDSVNRLDYSQLVTGGSTTTNLDPTYTANGNIDRRVDIASNAQWTYDPAHKNAVATAGANAYSYDLNGNMVSRLGYPIYWTGANYPKEIRSATETLLFDYGPDRQRWRQVVGSSAGTETTYFVGDALEKALLADGSTDYRHYVYANGQPVAIVSRSSSGANRVRYLLTDHAGSSSTILDETGTVLVNENFSAFGNGRDPGNWSSNVSTSDQALIAGLTRRGYTFHTNLGSPQLGLIHMNGRVMDATIGRFLSPDPYVTEPGNTQGFNRYSYVANNPMSYTDPTGFTNYWVTCKWYSSDSYDCSWTPELEEVTVTASRQNPFAGSSFDRPWYTNRFSGLGNNSSSNLWNFARNFPQEVRLSFGEGSIQDTFVDLTLGSAYDTVDDLQNGDYTAAVTSAVMLVAKPLKGVAIVSKAARAEKQAARDISAATSTERVSSKTLRNRWEKETGKKWPKDSETGRNHDVAHKKALADGGTNDVDNYEPLPHPEHVREHSDAGDFQRWGSRNSK
jgi:RHS repeat-associated protein